MRKIICILIFLCSIINSNATEEPIDIYRVRSIVFYNDGHWSPEYEYRGVITLFKDRIEEKSTLCVDSHKSYIKFKNNFDVDMK